MLFENNLVFTEKGILAGSCSLSRNEKSVHSHGSYLYKTSNLFRGSTYYIQENWEVLYQLLNTLCKNWYKTANLFRGCNYYVLENWQV